MLDLVVGRFVPPVVVTAAPDAGKGGLHWTTATISQPRRRAAEVLAGAR